MYLIQIVLVVFSVFAIISVVSKFRKGDLTVNQLALWCLFWVLVVVVALLPNTTALLAKLLGVGRGADSVVYLALALLYYLFFKANIRLEKMERNLTKIVRKEALSEVADKTFK